MQDREYIAEFADDNKYGFFENHLWCHVYGVDGNAAMEAAAKECVEMGEDYYVAQLSTKFTDCELPQPVYDAMNGWLVNPKALATCDSWTEIFDYQD